MHFVHATVLSVQRKHLFTPQYGVCRQLKPHACHAKLRCALQVHAPLRVAAPGVGGGGGKSHSVSCPVRCTRACQMKSTPAHPPSIARMRSQFFRVEVECEALLLDAPVQQVRERVASGERFVAPGRGWSRSSLTGPVLGCHSTSC